jgi:hypothetical protein
VEVEGHAGVVLLDHLPGGLLHGLGADATHGCLPFSGSGDGGYALASGCGGGGGLGQRILLGERREELIRRRPCGD